MQHTGMVRSVDRLGRITIPKELCRVLGLLGSSRVVLSLENNGIVIRRYTEPCCLCGRADDTFEVDGKFYCSHCRKNPQAAAMEKFVGDFSDKYAEKKKED